MSRWLLKDTQIIPKCHVQRKPYHAGLPSVGSIPTLLWQKQCLAPSLGPGQCQQHRHLYKGDRVVHGGGIRL